MKISLRTQVSFLSSLLFCLLFIEKLGLIWVRLFISMLSNNYDANFPLVLTSNLPSDGIRWKKLMFKGQLAK